MSRGYRRLGRTIARLAVSSRGSVTLQFSLVAVVLTGLVGGALDYTRAVRVRGSLQSALDEAALAGARDGTKNWSAVAQRTFEANLDPGMVAGSTPSFSVDSGGTVTGTITAGVATTLMRTVGFSTIDVSARAVATARQDLDNSCLLALDHGAGISDEALTLNGAPNLDFSKCTIRSNTSMQCNGHDGGSVRSIAAGSAQGCSNPISRQTTVPDIYAPLASNITKRCGSAHPGATWIAGQPLSGISNALQFGASELHVCGDLTLSGTGFLTGPNPAADTVVVVENGGINMAAASMIRTVRMTFVLTGNNSRASSISFPNGHGQGSTLALSPGTDPANPWRGISVYQDPTLTNSVDNDWGSGVSLTIDGVIYLPNSNITISGSATSNIDNCTKIVVNTLRVNGSVDLNLGQSAGCVRLGVNQWSDLSVYLSQ
jgi:Flp pilus assembly protein TadG